MPDRIVIYRDGVGDGQLQAVYEHELPQIEETFNKVQEGYAPKWAMIIVKKRGCSRFFAKNTVQLYNPVPGTIIDHTVTHQNWFDFYLISQCARQGTAAPTHFNVIWGEKLSLHRQFNLMLCFFLSSRSNNIQSRSYSTINI